MILDTYAVSSMLEGDSALEALLAREARHELPVIVVGEYRYGLARSRHRRSLLPLFDELIRESIVLSVGVETAAAYAAVRVAAGYVKAKSLTHSERSLETVGKQGLSRINNAIFRKQRT